MYLVLFLKLCIICLSNCEEVEVKNEEVSSRLGKICKLMLLFVAFWALGGSKGLREEKELIIKDKNSTPEHQQHYIT